MAHARRKFEHASDNDPELASEALKIFQGLYELEEPSREEKLSFDAIKEIRQKES
jgi:hypothetical protein